MTKLKRRRTRGLGDPIAEHNLRLTVDNEAALYRQKVAMRGAIAKKICRGQFDAAKAAKGFRHVVDAAAIVDAGATQARYAYPGKVRDAVAKELVAELKSDVNRCITKGDCGDAPAELSKCLATAKPLAGLRGRRRPKKRSK